MPNQVSKNFPVLISIFVVTFLGLNTKYYSGVWEEIVKAHFGGIFYVIFFCLIVYLFFPKFRSIYIVSVVFLLTCVIEFAQLWHPDFLQMIRSTYIGKILIGTSFSLMDFPFYLLGAVFAWIWVNILKKYV